MARRVVPPEEWEERFHNELPRAKFKALQETERQLSAGKNYSQRSRGKSPEPLPKTTKECQKYAEIRGRAVDRIIALAGGKKQIAEAEVEEPSFDELCDMGKDEQQDVLRKLLATGKISRHERKKVEAALEKHLRDLNETPEASERDPAAGQED